MIRAFAAALEDDDLLVRRGALDILLQSLRIDGVAVKKAQADDRAILMRAATSVVLRRDLALNRRLFAWLLGPVEGSQAQIEYYKQHSLELLRSTLRVMHTSLMQDERSLTSYRKRCSILRRNIHNQDRSRSSSRYWTNGRSGCHSPRSWSTTPSRRFGKLWNRGQMLVTMYALAICLFTLSLMINIL